MRTLLLEPLIWLTVAATWVINVGRRLWPI